MGNGKSVNTRQIEDFQKENSASFYRWYGDWKNKVKEEAEKRGYYDRSKRPYGILLLIVSAALFVLAIVTFAYGSLYGLISMISAFVILPYGLVLLNRRSDLGYEQYQKWIRFRKHWKSGRADSPAADVAYDAADASLIYALGLSIQQKSNGFSFEREKAAGEVYAYNDWLLWYFLFIDQDNHGFQKRFEDSFGGSLSGDSSSTGSFSGGGGGGAGGGGAGGF